MASEPCRLDRWLWAVRVCKTRVLAIEMCRAGKVDVGGKVVKPAREVRIGDAVTVRDGVITRQFVVLGWPVGRVGAKLVPNYCEDRTPAEEIERARLARVQHLLDRERGLGRPTKRDRRQLGEFFQF